MTPPQSAPAHVLMTADTVGGVWTFAMELCAGLCARGTRVTLVTMGALPSADQIAQAKAVSGLTLVPTAYRLEWMPESRGDVLASGDFLLDLARRLRPDLVHVNGYYHAALPFDAPLLLTAHSCVSSWWRACRGTPLPAAWDEYAGWVRRACAAADLLVAPTAAYLAEFQQLHGQARAARVIWNGRDPAGFQVATKTNSLLAAGRLWDEAKNISFLAAVLRDSGVALAVAGSADGPDGNIASFEGAQMLGLLSESAMAEALSKAAIFVSPARYEPFGLGVLEAAISGCALVLSDIPTFRELWDGVAKFVHPDDAPGWRKAIRHLAGNHTLASASGLSARRRARRYGAEAMVAEYQEAYRELLATPMRERAA